MPVSKAKGILTVAACSAIVTGCISYNEPADFTFQSAGVVTWGEQRELPAPFPNSEIKLDRQLLKIEFTSVEDFAGYLVENSYPGTVTAFFCERPNDPVFLSRSSIFWNGQDIGSLGGDVWHKSAPVAGRFTYYLYLDIAGKEGLPTDIPRHMAFDQRQRSEDICLHIRGGAGISGYQSNTMKIPKEELEKALRNR